MRGDFIEKDGVGWVQTVLRHIGLRGLSLWLKTSPTLKPRWWLPAPAEGHGAAAFVSSAAPSFISRVPSPPSRHGPVSVRADVPLPQNTGVRSVSERRKAAKNKNMQKKKKNSRHSPKHQKRVR